MEGMLNIKPRKLVPLARAWMRAPAIVDLKGAKGSYDPGQRAYVLINESGKLSLTIDCSKKSPLYNLAFVIKNWGDKSEAKVKVNGKNLAPGSGFRQGTIRDIDGTDTMTIWVEKKSTKPVVFEITK